MANTLRVIQDWPNPRAVLVQIEDYTAVRGTLRFEAADGEHPPRIVVEVEGLALEMFASHFGLRTGQNFGLAARDDEDTKPNVKGKK